MGEPGDLTSAMLIIGITSFDYESTTFARWWGRSRYAGYRGQYFDGRLQARPPFCPSVM